MSGYGGGYSTGYGGGGGDNGGGYMQSSQGGSQSGGVKTYSDGALRPVTIKQILDAEEPVQDSTPFRIDGLDVAQVTFVGMVRGISPQTTNVTYRIDDGTGVIEVKQWLDGEKQDSEYDKPQIQLDQYVRVWGRLRDFHSKRHVGCHMIKPVADFNEVNYHLLEATYVHLYFTKGAPGGAGGGGDEDSMFVDGGYGGGADSGASNPNLAGVSAKAKKMFQWMHNAEGGNEGIHIHMIAQGTGLSVPDVMAASEELTAPGLIYTTVDDETFAILSY